MGKPPDGMGLKVIIDGWEMGKSPDGMGLKVMIDGWEMGKSPDEMDLKVIPTVNLNKVRPLFMLLHRGSDNSPLLMVFSANYIAQSTVAFIWLKVR